MTTHRAYVLVCPHTCTDECTHRDTPLVAITAGPEDTPDALGKKKREVENGGMACHIVYGSPILFEGMKFIAVDMIGLGLTYKPLDPVAWVRSLPETETAPKVPAMPFIGDPRDLLRTPPPQRSCS